MKNKLFFLPLLFVSIAGFVGCNIKKATGTESGNRSSAAKWETGIALYSFHHHPFTTALAMADSAGIKYVEGFSFYKLGADFNDSTMGKLDKQGIAMMKQMLKEKRIKMSSMYVDGARNVEDWKKYFDLAKELDLQYLVCEPAKDHWDMIDSLAGLYKIKIAIHEHVRPSPYWHPDSVLAAVKGHANIGACADLGHWVRSGLDPVKCLQMLDGHIIGIHLKDVDDKGTDVDLGTGKIDFVAVVRELKRQHFKGIVDVECEHNMDNNLADVKQALRYITEMAKKVN